MRHLIILCTVVFFSLSVNAQIEFGLKAGISSYDLAKEGILVTNGSQNFQWNIDKARYGHHFGLYTRWTLLGIYIEPALLFNSNTVDFNIREYGEAGVFNTIKSEKYNHLDIPVMLGCKLGVLRFYGGVVGHFFINSISDLVAIDGYAQKFNNSTYGWQAGAGVDFWRMRLDMAFEGNFNAFGDHITIADQRFAFADTPNRLMLTLGFKF